MDWFNGKKTYIVAFVTAGLGLAMAIWPDFQLPEWAVYVLAAAGVTGLRMGMPAKPPSA